MARLLVTTGRFRISWTLHPDLRLRRARVSTASVVRTTRCFPSCRSPTQRSPRCEESDGVLALEEMEQDREGAAAFALEIRVAGEDESGVVVCDLEKP